MTNEKDKGDERPSEGKAEQRGQSFGTWLRQQRVVREIELREIAETSKISMRYLRALEDDRFEVLPASVFAKGFLRQYAKYVGLDPEEVINFFIAAREETESDEPPVVTKRKHSTSPWTYLGIFFLVAALLLGIVWLTDRKGNEQEAGAAASNADTVSTATDDVAPEASEPRPGSALPSADSNEETSVPGASAETGESGEGQEASTASGSNPGPASPSGSTATIPEPIPVSDAPLVITLDFSSDCWVEVTADGEPRFGEMRVQGESLRAEAQQEIVLKLGDVEAVEIEVNGYPYQVERVAGSAVRTVRIDLETVRSLTGGAA